MIVAALAGPAAAALFAPASTLYTANVATTGAGAAPARRESAASAE